MTFKNGPYLYKIVRTGSRSAFVVTDGVRAISIPILWAFGYGVGGVGQTYIFSFGGYDYESQVSYYEGIRGLSITMGHASYPPASLGQALGYPLSDAAVRKCFGCHATGAVMGNHLQTDKMILGVSCRPATALEPRILPPSSPGSSGTCESSIQEILPPDSSPISAAPATGARRKKKY